MHLNRSKHNVILCQPLYPTGPEPLLIKECILTLRVILVWKEDRSTRIDWILHMTSCNCTTIKITWNSFFMLTVCDPHHSPSSHLCCTHTPSHSFISLFIISFLHYTLSTCFPIAVLFALFITQWVSQEHGPYCLSAPATFIWWKSTGHTICDIWECVTYCSRSPFKWRWLCFLAGWMVVFL